MSKQPICSEHHSPLVKYECSRQDLYIIGNSIVNCEDKDSIDDHGIERNSLTFRIVIIR